MNVDAKVRNDKHIVAQRLKCLVGKVEELNSIEIPNPQTIVLEGNVFDIITSVYLFRNQYIKHGLGWDVMTLMVNPERPYQATLKYEVADESIHNKLKFQIKFQNYEKD